MQEPAAAARANGFDAVKRLIGSALGLRIISGAVLAGVALGATRAGGIVFASLVSALSVVLVFEWTRMVEGREFSRSFFALAISSALAMAFAARGAYEAAFGAAAAGGLAALLVGKGGRGAIWAAVGAPYLVGPSIALIWLRAGPNSGEALVLFLFLIVWATDSGAYIAGKSLRGPRFSPEISPGKTWSGLAGGALAGGAVAAIAGGAIFNTEAPGFFLLLGVAVALATELGDMVESAIKRRFGVKDVSGFIPGHGGALDRLDGMIFATFAMAAVVAAVSYLQGP